MNVLITGTAGGIGKAIAEKFLGEGHVVYGFDINKSVISNKNYFHYLCDIADTEISLPELPPINILVNNAGTQNRDDITNNLRGTIRITENYAIQSSIKSVLMVSSASALSGAEFPEYCASKGGINAYGKNVAHRIAEYGATCNNLCPGGVRTSLNAHILEDPELYDKVLAETMLGRWAEPEEIASWVYFLTVINKFMTSQNLLVDGGEAAKFNFIW